MVAFDVVRLVGNICNPATRAIPLALLVYIIHFILICAHSLGQN